jgi:hypothetical protein
MLMAGDAMAVRLIYLVLLSRMETGVLKKSTYTLHKSADRVSHLEK